MCGTPGGPGGLNQQPFFWPGKSRAGRGLRGSGCPAPERPAAPSSFPSRPLGAGSGSFQGPVAAFPRLPWAAHTFLPFLTDPCPSSFLPVTGLNFWTSLPALRLPPPSCLLGESPGPPSGPSPGPSARPGPGSSSRRTAVRSSRHSRVLLAPGRAPASSPPLWVGAGGGGFRVELPGVLFYSFNSFTFPFLLCVTFTYLLIYNRSGSFPFLRGLQFPSGLSAGTSAPPSQLLASTRLPSNTLIALSLLRVS